MAKSHYKYTCFDSRSLNEARLVFAFAGVEFEEDLFTRSTWPEEKSNYPWGQLPTLEVDGKFLSQSKSIVRFLGKTFNCAGDNELEAAKCDEMIEAMSDLQKPFFKAFHEQHVKKKEELTKSLNEKLEKLLRILDKTVSDNKGFLVGNRFSYADIYIASCLQVFGDLLEENILNPFPALKCHNLAVFDTPGIKKWVASRPTSKF